MTHGPPIDPLPYATPAPGGKWRRHAKVGILLGSALAACALAYAVVAPSLRRPGPEGADRVACARNLRQIGAAVRADARQNGGAFPDTLERLVAAKALAPGVLVCPADDEAPAPPAPAGGAADSTAAARRSYEYVGKDMDRGLGRAALAEVVVAFEPPRSHGGACHVLFGNGRVVRVPAPAAERLIAEVRAGKNPPTSTD